MTRERDAVVLMPCQNQRGVESALAWQMGLYALRAHVVRFPDIAARFDLHMLPWSGTDFGGDSLCPELALDELLARIVALQPRVVAFSLYVHTLLPARRMANLLKGLLPGVRVVVGGPEVAGRERFAREYPMFDIAVEGTGELPFRRLLQKMAAGDDDLSDIPNLSFRGPDGAFVHNPGADVDEDPATLPNAFAQAVDEVDGTVVYVKSRGCNRRCTYCGWAAQPIRSKPTALMLDELETLLATGRVRTLQFMDADFLRMEREEPGTFAALADLLARHGNPRLNVFCYLRGLVDPALPEVAARLNVQEIMVGLQSLNPVALEAVNRGWEVPDLPLLEQVDPALRRMVVLQLMVPLPGETVASFHAGLERLSSLGFLRLQVFQTMVLHGTRLRADAERHGLKHLTVPPYLAFETATMPAFGALGAAAMGVVLTQLLQVAGQGPDGWDRLVRLWERHPRLAADVRKALDEDRDVERTLARFLPGVAGDGGGTTGWSGQHAARGDGHHLPRTAFPPTDRIRQVLDLRGMRWEGEGVEGARLALAASGPAGHCIVWLFPATVPEPCYREDRGFRIAYHGELADLSVLDELLDLCGPESPARE